MMTSSMGLPFNPVAAARSLGVQPHSLVQKPSISDGSSMVAIFSDPITGGYYLGHAIGFFCSLGRGTSSASLSSFQLGPSGHRAFSISDSTLFMRQEHE
ncbi:hypothetical protein L3X38_005716 [Prunus dulcis]|uniref:Uncharacterized protein n=1 Tax=Prunus dulcis TaxID=3755 RepID=A0AAD4ZRE8_PRUDU|nr:hypothetical protein L3X38_005716 [Prunus dulcis]